MVKNLYFDYCAIAILFIMLIALFFKRGGKGRTNRAFLYLVLTMIYATLYDICAVFLDNRGYNSAAFKYVMHSGYLILRNLVPVMYMYYVITLTDIWHILVKWAKQFFLVNVPFFAVVVLTLSSPITKLIFYIDENEKYTRGPLFFILYISAVFYLFVSLIVVCRNYKQLTLSKFVPLIMIIPLQGISTAIQLVNPTLLVELFFSAISLLYVMLTIQRPEAMMDPNTGLFRRGIYSENIRLSCLNKKPLRVVFIRITNYNSINSLVSYSTLSRILLKTGNSLKKIAKDIQLDESEFYYLNNGHFAITLEQYNKKKTDLLVASLKALFSHEISVDNTSYSLPANICILNIPEDLSQFDEISAFEEDLSTFKFSSDVIDASEIVKKKDYKIVARMDSILDDAIKNRRFEVYYQPIYSLKDKAFTSAEALIRLKTEEYGFIRPDIFIPIAEESGAIHEIDQIVLEKVCEFISSDEYKALGLHYIEVNLSVVECMQPGLATNILNTLHKYKVSPSQINLEITETASDYSQKTIDDNITVMTYAGIPFSLDDFGTGYSNMTRIASLPLSLVKLDRAFTDTKNNPTLLLILEKTINMIKKMNMKIVVEGIETKEMVDQFNALGCDYIQGYYYSKPLPKEEFIKFISDNK